MPNPFRMEVDELGYRYNTSLKFRIASNILERWAMVAGYRGREEDRAGRRTTELLPVPETVERALALADLFVERAFEKGWVKELPLTDEEIIQRVTDLEDLRRDLRFPKPTSAVESK